MNRMRMVTIALLVLVGSVAQAQWQYKGVFAAGGVVLGDTVHRGDIHGLAVDPAGKVWIMNYYAYARDSLYVGANQNKFIAVRALYAHNPDGSQLSFSPIKTVTIGGRADTLGGGTLAAGTWSANTGRGMRADHQGNILASYFGYIYRINYRTGAGMAKVVVDPANAIISPGVDTSGNIFVNIVAAGGKPLKIYDKDFNFIGNARDSLAGFSRAIEASKDGNDIYYAGYTNHAVFRYRSQFGILGPYAQVDTILKGMCVESFAWQPRTGWLWVSSGSGNDLPNRYPGTVTNWSSHTWYAYNPVTGTVVDSIKWQDVKHAGNQRPRGIAFSPTGDTVYVASFGTSAYEGVQWFVRGPALSVERNNDLVPTTLALSQNYPNPFNPLTKIDFSITVGGYTTLKVYDVMGREVASLVEESLAPGKYTATFRSADLASGTYVYVLNSGGHRLANKMILLK